MTVSRPLVHLGCLWWAGSHPERRPQASVNVVITESPLQRRERWLSSAVTGCNVFDSEPIVQLGDNLLDVRIRGYHKMKTANDKVNVRVNRGCRFDDFVGTGMRTPNYDDESFRGIDDE